jgi:hypothetical protein
MDDPISCLPELNNPSPRLSLNDGLHEYQLISSTEPMAN